MGLTCFTKEQIQELRNMFSKETTVKLICSTDETMQDRLGMCMTVEYVDDIGQLHGRWEDGSSLAINLETDTLVKV